MISCFQGFIIIEDIIALIHEANESNIQEVLRKMDPLVMQLARNGTEKEKSALITAFLTCWAWDLPKEEKPQLQAQAFYPVFQRFLPYLNSAEARIMSLDRVLLLGTAIKNFTEVMAKHIGPELQRSNVETTESYMQSIIDFLPAVTDDDLSSMDVQYLSILNEVALYLVTNLTPRVLDNLSLILPYLDEQTKQTVVSRLKSKFMTADSTTKAAVSEAFAHFLVSNLHYFSQETIRKLQDWAMRLISGSDGANSVLGRALMEGSLHQLNEEEQQKARFMLRLFS